jgi:L-amino acid N-acyltransferase YncA
MTLHTTSTPENINIVALNHDETSMLGTASANPHPLKSPDEKCWWISRVLVSQSSNRGRGIGGALLDRLLSEILAQGGRSVIVTPGGYNADPVRQVRFYEQHDFIRVGSGPTSHWTWNDSLTARQALAKRGFNSEGVSTPPNLEALLGAPEKP